MGLIRNGKSTLFTSLDGIVDLIANEIDNDQEIKRLLFYLTKSPLLDVGISYTNKRYYQRDLECSLLKPQTIDVGKIQNGKETIKTEQILYKTGFQNDKISDDYPVIFCHSYKDDIRLTGENIFLIDIIMPIIYDELVDGTRLHKLMVRIGDLFHLTETDEISSEELNGNYKFRVYQGITITEEKLVKSKDSVIVTIPIGVTCVNARGNNGRIL